MRVIGSFIISVIILFVGFYATVMTLLSTGNEQYSLVVAAFVLMLLIFANLLVWERFSKKAVRYGFIGLFCCFILFVVYENVKGWHLRSLQVMSTQDVDLSVYEPFVKDSLVATLDTSASLKVEEPLLKLDGSTALYPVFLHLHKLYIQKDLMTQQTVKCNQRKLRGLGLIY